MVFFCLFSVLLSHKEKKNDQTVNALRVVQAVNVHNITHYIHVISECTPSHAVSNLCDRFRWTLVKGALRGESSLGVTQADSTKSPAGRKEPCSTQSCCLSSLPTRTAKIQACKLYNRLRWIAFTKIKNTKDGKTFKFKFKENR